ncbi:hypothetical protein THOM_1212 [Trachipleistophora hominis]|uniref:Uncharacterized protein n=1 Tax=Trachipleistophora hominis TaxID=72359 RepID=L7JX09_TRAHO|nr:hypothetical protein THOM_1212 [Trachipleistophora hominis]
MFDIVGADFDLDTMPSFITRYAVNEEYNGNRKGVRRGNGGNNNTIISNGYKNMVTNSSTDIAVKGPLPYTMVSVNANKTLITDLLRTRSYDLINTLIRTKEDVSIAIDTQTHIITLIGNVTIENGQLQKLREKRIHVNIPVFTNAHMLITLRKYTDILVLSTYARNAHELRTENEMKWFLRGMGMVRGCVNVCVAIGTV